MSLRPKCTAFVSSTTFRSRSGSTQIDVPVKPVWPNVLGDMSAPHEFSSVVFSAQPSPRRSTAS